MPTLSETLHVTPMLRPEVGQHTARITCLDVDRDGRLFVTGSKDKTARIWSLPGARLLRVIRTPLVQGDGGEVSAVALSPDGRTVAVGSHVNCRRYIDLAGVVRPSGDALSPSVTLSEEHLQVVDASTGQLVRNLPEIEGEAGLRRVAALAFSPHGHYLAASGFGGLRVWQTRDWQEIFADPYAGTSYGVAFDGAGRLVTTSDDGSLRMYGSLDHAEGFCILKELPFPEGSIPRGLAFSPDGERLAVGLQNVSAVMLLCAADFSFVSYLYPSRVDNLGLVSVTWSANGRFLYAAGQHNEEGMRLILRWGMTGKTRPKALRFPRNTVTGLRAFGEAGVLFAAADPCFGAFDGRGKEVFCSGPGTAVMRGKLGDAFRVSPDGRAVRFGLEYGTEMPVRFDLDRRQVTSAMEADETLVPARTEGRGLKLENWEHTLQPKLNGKPLALAEREKLHCVAVAPDGASFVLGGDWSLRLFGRDGEQIWEQPTPSAAWGVNIPPGGRVVLAAYGDGTVRWHSLEDGSEILILLVHPDGLRWVVWTQEGYYDASAGADGLIGWHVGRGEDEMPDFLPAWRFHDRFCRPEVIARVLDTLDVADAVRQADSAAEREARPADLRRLLQKQPPPSVQLLFPHDGHVFKQHEVALQYLLRHPPHPAEVEVRALIDGHAEEWLAPGASVQAQAAEQSEVTVWLPPHDITLALEARVGTATARSEPIRLLWGGRAPQPKPTLYALAVGVSQYKTCKSLQFAHQDAEDFAVAMRGQEGELYGQVVARTLSNGKATLRGILDGLQWLAKQRRGSSDLTILFLAGHGLTDPDNRYYFLPHDVELSSLRATGLAQETLFQFLDAIKKGKRLVLLDTCHAGAIAGLGAACVGSGIAFAQPAARVDIDRFANELARGIGVEVITSSTGTLNSLEDPRWKHGAFTEALLEGLHGKADYQGNGVITVNELNLYLGQRVRVLTGDKQTPMVAGVWSDFPIARVHASSEGTADRRICPGAGLASAERG